MKRTLLAAFAAFFIAACTPAVVAEKQELQEVNAQISKVEIEDTEFEIARLKEEQTQYKREEAIRQAYDNMSDAERMRGIVYEPIN